jgi:CheY-like chemotaxis protein
VTAQYLNHPALTLGYRLEADGTAVVYACDHEPHSRALAGGDGDIDGHDRRHAEFLASADLVIHDAQYTAAEYEGKKGWGHSTAEYAAEVARSAGVHRLALTHHDPRRDDDAVDRIVAAIRQRVTDSGSAMEVFGAAEGQVVELQAAPDRHLQLLTGEVAAAPPQASALFERTVVVGVADPQLAATLREAIAADRIHAIVETDGEGVLARVLEAPASLVILQEDLPGMDGPAVCRAIRSRAAKEEDDLPIIVVANRERKAAAGDADGVSDWLVKPFSTAYLRTRARSWLLRTACRWEKAPLPPDEEKRLAALHKLAILDTPPEERFDRLTRLAAAIFDVPTALVSLVDRDRQWFKAGYGDLPRETPREESFCAHAVVNRAPLVVPDAMDDDRFADNPTVTGEPRVRFYAGQPLILPDGACVGTVCLVDTRPRELDERQKGLLADLGELVRRELLLPKA